VFDFNKKGRLGLNEVKSVLMIVDRWDLEAAIQELDEDGSGKVG
jgi:hypothetical protein